MNMLKLIIENTKNNPFLQKNNNKSNKRFIIK